MSVQCKFYEPTSQGNCRTIIQGKKKKLFLVLGFYQGEQVLMSEFHIKVEGKIVRVITLVYSMPIMMQNTGQDSIDVTIYTFHVIYKMI